MNRAAIALLLLAVASIPGDSVADDYALVSVKAHHFERDIWQEWNPGLILERRQDWKHGFQGSWGGGIVRDSLGNWSPNASYGVHYVTGPFSFGVDGAVHYRHRYADGTHAGVRLAPAIPRVEFMPGRFGLSFAYLAKGTKSESASVLMLVKIRLAGSRS